MISDWLSWLSVGADIMVALGTGALAWFTWRLVKETVDSRRQEENRRKELAFRAAMVEMASNIGNLHKWDPRLHQPPSPNWLERPLKYTRLHEVLGTVWIHRGLWERVLAIVNRLEKYETELQGVRKPGEAVKSSDMERAKSAYYVTDLYLKQVACYLACEMRRQGIRLPHDSWIDRASIFRPLAWVYGDVNLPPETAAASLESPPWSMPSEPDDPAFAACTLARLIRQAHEDASKPKLGQP